MHIQQETLHSSTSLTIWGVATNGKHAVQMIVG